jgi:hypothetical protein
VQASDCTGLGAAQLELQQAGEQVVIPEPGARGVQRQHERVRLFQVLQQPLRATAPAEQVGQLAVDPLEDAGAQQQAPHRCGLPVQYLRQEILRYGPLTARELRREPARIGMPSQRQRRQPQPGRPPLRPVHQQLHHGIGKLRPRPGQQLASLCHREAQVLGPYFGQVSLQPQPVQPQPHIMPGGQHKPQLLRRAQHQQLQLPARLIRMQLMQIINHQPQPFAQRCQIRQEPFGDRPPIQIRRCRQRSHQNRPGRRLPERVQH